MSKKEERRPSIRFKGYTEPWEQRKLGDISTSFSGGTPVAGNKRYYGGDIPFIRSAEINSDSTELFLTNEGLENSSAKLVKKGDILYALYGATSGEVDISKINGAINQAILCIVPKINYNSEFIMQWLKHRKKNITDKYLQGGQGNLSATLVKELDISFPVFPEQAAIGSFFQELDQLITLQQRELDLMKEGKKTLLSKMFPKDGENFPEIRFPGFTNAWEQRKLGEVSNRVKGNDGRMDLPTLTISAGQGWLDQKERFSGNIAGKEQKNYTLLTRGELSYNHGNSKLAKYGAVFQLNDFEEALVPKVYHSFKMVDGNSGLFIEYLFSTKLPDKELRKLISSGARMDGLLNITYNDFVTINLTIPRNKEEQIAIGSFFQELDQLITLQQRELEILKTMKSTLLKAMFA